MSFTENNSDVEEHAVLRIHEAAFGGEIEDVEAFLETASDIDIVDKTGMTPLLFAIWGGHLETARLLYDVGGDINHVAHSTGNNALHLVASQTHFDMVKWVVDTMGETGLSSLNHLGRNPLHLACQAGSIESLEYMVERGGDLTTVASNGDTPLHVCVSEGHIKMTSLLIDLGADYDAVNKLGLTPLHLAVQSGHRHIVDDLLTIPEIEIHKLAKNGLSAVMMAERNKVEEPEIAAALAAAARERPPPKPARTPYQSRTLQRRSSRTAGSKAPGRGLIRAESKAAIMSKAAITKFDSMLSDAESEEARRLKIMKEQEEAKRVEAERQAAREAKERELAQARLEEEKKQRLEEKKRKLKAAEEAQKAKEEAERKAREEKEKERLRKEAEEAERRRLAEEQARKEREEAERAARLQKEEEERKAAAERAARLQREEEERKAAAERIEAERLEREKAAAEEEAERQRQEAEKQALIKIEEQRLREEAAARKQMEDDMAAKSRFEAEKARAEAEKAIAEAEKAKAESEKAKAEAAKAKAEAELSRKKAEILEHAARLRQEEAEEARARREQERRKLEMQSSFNEQRSEIEAEVSKAEQTAAEKQEALRAAEQQAELEKMRLKVEEAPHKSIQQSQRLEGAVDLSTATHAGVSLKRLNDRARMSQRSLTALQSVQGGRHRFSKTHSMPVENGRHVYGSFSSEDPERGGRHSIGTSHHGLNRSPSLFGPVRHSFGGEESASRAGGWDKVRRSFIGNDRGVSGSGRYSSSSNDYSSGVNGRDSGSAVNGSGVSSGGYGRRGRGSTGERDRPPAKKSVSMEVSPPQSVGATSRASRPALSPFSPGGLSFESGTFSIDETDRDQDDVFDSFGSARSEEQDLPVELTSPLADKKTAEEAPLPSNGNVSRSEGGGGSREQTESDDQAGQREKASTSNDRPEKEKDGAAARLAAKKKAEAERVRAKRQAEAKNFERRRSAAEAQAEVSSKKLQAEELAKVMYLEAVLDSASSDKAKVDAEEAARVRAARELINSSHQEKFQEMHQDKLSKIELPSGVKDQARKEVEKKIDLTIQKERAEEKAAAQTLPTTSSLGGGKEKADGSVEEKKAADQTQSHVRKMPPRIKSLVLGDFSIRHPSLSSMSAASASDTEKKVKEANVKKASTAALDSSSDSSVGSMMSDDVFAAHGVANGASKSLQQSSRSDDDRLSFEERKSIEKDAKRSKRFSGQRNGLSAEEEMERRNRFQSGENSSSFVRKSLSSQNHAHDKSASRLGDLVVKENAETRSAFNEIDTMEEFDELLGAFINRQSKLSRYDEYPEDLLEQEQSMDNYISDAVRRGSEIEWRLGQLEVKMPNPKSIRDIRKLLHRKVATLKKLQDRNRDGNNLSSSELDMLRQELHKLRNTCLEAVDRERVELKDPEHILQEELDQIASL